MDQLPEKNIMTEATRMPPMAQKSMTVCKRPATTFLHSDTAHHRHSTTAPIIRARLSWMAPLRNCQFSQSMMPRTPAAGTASQAHMMSQALQKPACLLMPTVLNTRHDPVLGSIVESSEYTKPIGKIMSVMRMKPKNVAGPQYDIKMPSQ